MLVVWPGNINKYTIIADWVIFANLLVAEIFHFFYAVVHRNDIITALLVSATVTTTMEVRILNIWKYILIYRILSI